MKHRKFVEGLKGPPSAFLPLVRCIHDARFEPYGKEEGAFTAGSDAAVGAGSELRLDMHGFSTQVISLKPKPAGKGAAKGGA
jgi:hypothetical protein